MNNDRTNDVVKNWYCETMKEHVHNYMIHKWNIYVRIEDIHIMNSAIILI